MRPRSRGALVLWVGVLSVIFLQRHLFLYQWLSLVIVTLGVCLVGLSGSLVKKELGSDAPSLVATVIQITKRADDDPTKVALGVLLILFAQVFTASQYVIEERIMSNFKVEPLVSTYNIFLKISSSNFSSATLGHRLLSLNLFAARCHIRRILRPRHDPRCNAISPSSIPRSLSLL